MNTIKLIFLNIRKLFKESGSILFFILTGIVFATFGIFFYSGYFMYNYYDANCSCELDITASHTEDVGQLKALIREIIEDDSFNRILVSDAAERDLYDADIVGLYEREFHSHLFCGTPYSYDSDEPLAVVSEQAVNELGFNRNITDESINYLKKEYEIAGIYAGYLKFGVSPYYFAAHYPVRNIHAEFDDAVSSELIAYIENKGLSFELTSNNSPFKSPEFLLNLLLVLTIFSVSFVNILTMFSFWTIKMKQTFRVYYIYGCDRMHKFFIVSGQVFVISILGTLGGFAVFLLCYRKLAELTIISAENMLNYFWVLLFTILVLLLLSVYYGIKVAMTQETSFRAKE